MFNLTEYMKPENRKLRSQKDVVSGNFLKLVAGKGSMPFSLWSKVCTLDKMFPRNTEMKQDMLSRFQVADTVKDLNMISLGFRCFANSLEHR